MRKDPMRIVLKICHIVIGTLLVLSTAFQLLAMFGGVLFNKWNNLATTMPWLVPLWGIMLALLIAAYVLLVKKGDRYPWQPILIAAALVGAIAALVVAITLRDALPEHLDVTGNTQGLTPWRLLYRHMSSVLVGVLIAIEAGVRWILHHRAQRRAQDDAADPAASTIGLDNFAGDDTYAKPKRLKRSQKRAAAKAKNAEIGE